MRGPSDAARCASTGAPTSRLPPHSSQFPPLSPQGELPDYPSLRAWDEHSFIVRVLRARRMVWQFPVPLDRCTLPLAIIRRPIHLEIENVLSPATIIQRSRRMKLLIGTVATVSGVLFALSM